MDAWIEKEYRKRNPTSSFNRTHRNVFDDRSNRSLFVERNSEIK